MINYTSIETWQTIQRIATILEIDILEGKVAKY